MKKHYSIWATVLMGFIIFISFYIMDIGFRTLIDSNFYPVFKVSPNFFTFSIIFIFIGIYFLINNRYRKFFYIVLNFINIVLVYLEYLNYKVSSNIMFDHLFLDIKTLISYTDYKILVVSILSFIVSLLIIPVDNNIKKISNYQRLIVILVTILVSGIFTFLAITNLGPKVILTSGKKSEAAKNIYLEKNDMIKSIQVSGVYDNNFYQIRTLIGEKFKANQEKIIKNYN